MGKILITGAESDAAVSLIRTLSRCGHEVLAGSSEPLAAGFFLVAPENRVVLSAPECAVFGEAILAVARRLGVDALIPTTEEDVRALSGLVSAFEDAGVALVVAEAQAVRSVEDAFVLAARCAGICAPKTRLLDENFHFSGVEPVVVRPRFGGGASRVIRRREELALLPRDGSYVAHSYLPGESCTVDVFAHPDTCEPLTAVAHVRECSREGGSSVTRVEDDPELLALAKAVVRAMRVGWASTVHFTRDASGRPKLTGIEPRFTTGVELTVAAGVLTSTWAVAKVMDEPLPRFRSPKDIAMIDTRSSIAVRGEQVDELLMVADPMDAPRRVA